MDVTINKCSDDLQSCTITTGVSSLNYYYEHMQPSENSESFLYSYMSVSGIKNITKFDNYSVIIDFGDSNVKEIVFELLNYLLAFNVEIHIKVCNDALINDDTEQCMVLLNRLAKYKLIKLKINDKSSELPKEKESSSWIQKLKNTFFFTGAGNTGKTSLITALSELCTEKGHRVALIDLTEGKKLNSYFTNIYPLIKTSPQENFSLDKVEDNQNKAVVNVYAYRFKGLMSLIEEKAFYESIRKISSIYDYVFVNSDINTVNTKSEIFNIGEKVFIVHDLMPTKINSAKQILLKFNEVGINTKGNIALIYNKMVKCKSNIGLIEEKLIFNRVDNKRLVPLVDLDCETFEIPYSKKTMEAMINHISHKSSIINKVAYSYRRNTDYLYKYINNIQYLEMGDLNLTEYAKESLNNLVHTYIKTIKSFKEEAYRLIAYMKKRKKILYLINSIILGRQ